MVIKKQSLLIFLYLSIISSYVNATAIAKLDRTSISINETVQLNIILDESSMFSGPDLSKLEKDFDILGSNKSSQSSWINGKKSAKTTWSYELAPKQAGVFTIPAIDVDGQQTQVISIQIKPANTNPSDRAGVEPVFIEAFTDKASVYVQEQILLTLRINTSINLNDLQLDDINIDDTFIKQINNTKYNRNMNGIPHITYEVTYAIFPQVSGVLNIPSIKATGVAPLQRSARGGFGSMFNQGKKLRMRSNPLTITVNKIPAAANSRNWLPAKQLQLQESWSTDPTEIKVGDSITRTITTTAVGLTGEQLPPIFIEAAEKFKSYPDQALFENQENDQGVIGIRKDAIALVATQAGKIVLPQITVEWWDITSNTQQIATLPKITINVIGTSNIPAPIIASATPATVPEVELNNATPAMKNITNPEELIMWQISAAIASALALLFMILFVHARKNIITVEEVTDSPPQHSSADIYLKELSTACTNRNTQAIRTSLLHWAQLTWPNSTLHSTVDVARLFNDNNFALRMKNLDAILFSGEESIENWQGLYDQVEEIHQQLNVKNKQKLAPLYPAK